MDNFIFSIVSAGHIIHYTLKSLIMNEATGGFLIGFIGAGIIAMLVITEHPKRIPLILAHSPSDSFKKVMKKGKKGTYFVSYSAFQREYNRIRVVFYSMLTMFFVVVIFAFIKY